MNKSCAVNASTPFTVHALHSLIALLLVKVLYTIIPTVMTSSCIEFTSTTSSCLEFTSAFYLAISCLSFKQVSVLICIGTHHTCLELILCFTGVIKSSWVTESKTQNVPVWHLPLPRFQTTVIDWETDFIGADAFVFRLFNFLLIS